MNFHLNKKYILKYKRIKIYIIVICMIHLQKDKVHKIIGEIEYVKK